MMQTAIELDDDDAKQGGMKNAFDKVAVGLGDAIAYADGDRSRGRVAGVNGKGVRAGTKMSQAGCGDTDSSRLLPIAQRPDR